MSQDIIPYAEITLTREDQLAHIYGEVASGRSLDSILRDDEGLPARSVFWRWHMADENIRDDLARARQNGVEALLEQALEVSQTPMEAQEITLEAGPDGTKRRVTTKDALGHRRLVVETIIQRARMIAPRKYGPKLDVTTDGEKISSIADAIRAGNERVAREERGE